MNFTNKLCWLAGFFDGDGSVGVYKKKRKNDKYSDYKYSPFISFSNNDPNIINEVDRLCIKLGVKMLLQTRHVEEKGWGINYLLTCQEYTGCYIILSNLYPYLQGHKKAIAQLTMRFLSSRKLGKTREKYNSLEHQLYNFIRDKTKRGNNKDILPSETTRDAGELRISPEDIVRTPAKSGEIDRNNLSPQSEE